MAKDKKAAKAKSKTKEKAVKASAKTKVKAKATAKPAAKKAAKGGAELTPIQKAQAARAANKKSGKSPAKRAKKKRVTFKAPADLKPIFLKADLVIGKDGHMTQSRFTSIKGKLGADTAKVIELAKYDPSTANAAVARIAGPLFIKSEKKRLAPGLMLSAIFRVMKNKEGMLGVRLKEVKAKMPEKKAKAVAKKDVIYRTVRKAARPLEAAFTKLAEFPSNKELKAFAETAEA